MLYNLCEGNLVEINDSIGNVSISSDEMQAIMGLSGSKSLYGSDILCIDVDLGVRTKISSIKYYFNSTSASGVVISSLNISHKDEYLDDYVEDFISIDSGAYYATISGVSSPRYVRLIHTVSGTSISGTLVGFQILNDDTIVDFGEDGTDNSFDVIATADGVPYINNGYVFNSYDTRVKAYVKYVPAGSDVDEAISLSSSSTGPWNSIKDTVISDPEKNSQTLVRNHPEYDKLGKVHNNLFKIEDNYLAGCFTTKIFKLDGKKFNSLAVFGDLPEGTRIAVDEEDIEPTIEIRSCNNKPEDFSYYRLYGLSDNLGSNYYYFTSDLYDLKTGVFHKHCPQVIDRQNNSTSTYSRSFFDTMDNNNEYLYQLNLKRRDNDYRIYYLKSKTTDINFSYNLSVVLSSTSNSSISFIPLSVLPDISGGCWLYFYIANSNIGPGYFLYYYSDLGQLLYNSGVLQFKDIYSCDVVYGTGHLWYTNTAINTVFKIDSFGQTVVSFIPDVETYNLKGICSTSDGGCWFINGNDLYRSDSDGNIIDVIDNLDVHTGFKEIALDGDDGLWVIDGQYVRNFSISRRSILFDVLVGQPRQFRPSGTSDGILVHCEDLYNKFINKNTQSITNSFYNKVTVPGPFSISFDNSNFSGKLYNTDSFTRGSYVTQSHNGGSSNPSRAVDGVADYENDFWEPYYYYYSPPSWIKFKCNSFFVPKIARLYFENTNNYTFGVQASVDDLNWVELYSSGSTYHYADQITECSFITNTNSYKYFRLFFYSGNYVAARLFEAEFVGLSPYFPHERDSFWNNLEWRKVPLKNFNFSTDLYHQVRVTLRRDSLAESPSIEGVYAYKSTDLGYIDPGMSKEFFLKVETTNSNEEILGKHASEILAFFEVPV